MIKNLSKYEKIKVILINFGPQHPAAHGVLRLVLSLDSEKIVRADPHIGLLHRGTEKLMENKMILQSLPYFDRLDYVSMMAQEYAYSLVIEELISKDYFNNMGLILKITKRSKLLRILFVELTRILNHLLAVTTHAMDVGAFSPYFWAFEEREKLMEFYEQVSGARMHSGFLRPGGLSFDIPDSLLEDILIFCNSFFFRINDIDDILSGTRIWKERLVNIGIISVKDALSFNFSGVMLRGSGMVWDLRKNLAYDNYNDFDFSIPVGSNGDCYDRYLIRLNEMRESLKIIIQIINNIKTGAIKLSLNKVMNPSRVYMKKEMSSLIHHFKFFSENLSLSKNFKYTAIEAPKGEFGVFILGNNTYKPYRARLHAPGFFHLSGLDYMSRNHSLADLVTILGTQDIVFGEVDR